LNLKQHDDSYEEGRGNVIPSRPLNEENYQFMQREHALIQKRYLEIASKVARLEQQLDQQGGGHLTKEQQHMLALYPSLEMKHGENLDELTTLKQRYDESLKEITGLKAQMARIARKHPIIPLEPYTPPELYDPTAALAVRSWVAPDILPEYGVVAIAGKSETGKSRFLTHGLACGGCGQPLLGKSMSQRSMLCLTTEDGRLTVEERLHLPYLHRMMSQFPGKLAIHDDWPPLLDGGYEYLENWAKDNRDGIVGMDMLLDLLPEARGSYDRERYFTRELVRFAQEQHLTILFTLHTVKAMNQLELDKVRGHSGVVSAASVRWLMSRTGQTVELKVSGRVVYPQYFTLNYNDTDGWAATPGGSGMTVAWKEVFDHMQNVNAALTIREITDGLNVQQSHSQDQLSINTVRSRIHAMEKQGLVRKVIDDRHYEPVK